MDRDSTVIIELINWCRYAAIEVVRTRPNDPRAAGERYFHEFIARLTAVGLADRVEKMKPKRWSTVERIAAYLGLAGLPANSWIVVGNRYLGVVSRTGLMREAAKAVRL